MTDFLDHALQLTTDSDTRPEYDVHYRLQVERLPRPASADAHLTVISCDRPACTAEVAGPPHTTKPAAARSATFAAEAARWQVLRIDGVTHTLCPAHVNQELRIACSRLYDEFGMPTDPRLPTCGADGRPLRGVASGVTRIVKGETHADAVVRLMTGGAS